MIWSWPWLGRRSQGTELVVLDDFFPNLLTGFRVAEYNAYLTAYQNVRVLSALADFDTEHARYAQRYPALASRVARYSRKELRRAACAYLNFLNNAFHFLPDLERYSIPFALTLYPGGGFGLHEPESDRKLLRVLASPLLRALTVTQAVSKTYVEDFGRENSLHLPTIRCIPGVVVNPMYFDQKLAPHGSYFGEGKDTLDICFVAEKYMPRGENKGYPEFIAVAHALRDEPALRFHIVGSFTADDIDVQALGDRISFHGYLETGDFPNFFANIDMVISPNRPFCLHPGNFDGFPTGGCVEAALCGVLLMASDELQQDPGYADNEAMLILPPDVDQMASALKELLRQPARVGQMARKGQALTRSLYAPRIQIGQRQAALEDLAGSLSLDLKPAST